MHGDGRQQGVQTNFLRRRILIQLLILKRVKNFRHWQCRAVVPSEVEARRCMAERRRPPSRPCLTTTLASRTLSRLRGENNSLVIHANLLWWLFGRNLEPSRVVKDGGIIRESMPAVKLSGSIMQNIADWNQLFRISDLLNCETKAAPVMQQGTGSPRTKDTRSGV